MRVLSKEKEIREFLQRLRDRSPDENPELEKAVRRILRDVKEKGDDAVLAYTKKFDRGGTGKLRISGSEIARASQKAEPAVVKALQLSARRIRRFHEKQRERSWSFSEKGSILGQAIRPLRRVGVYVPGGKAAYPSTVLMNVIPAQVAGVNEIAICVPCPGGHINPYVMAAVRMLHVEEIYAVGGAQAIGAMAYGTNKIERVDKIVGPGNAFVASAKKFVFGTVDIDMIAGPSEIVVIADDSADPRFVAADLLSQAEHDELASSILVTDSRALAVKVSDEIERQIALLERQEIARASLAGYGAIIVSTKYLELVDRIAPEHLEILTRDPVETAKSVRNAGAVFLGAWTPEALGDYSAGPNHTLPTGGTARFSSPLGVYDFYKRSSVLGFSREAFMRLAPTVEKIASIEGLGAHANTVRVRTTAIKNVRKGLRNENKK